MTCIREFRGPTKALDSVSLITIRKFARKLWKYVDIYRKGITGKMAEFTVKKYKSHHRRNQKYRMNYSVTLKSG